MNKKSRRDFIKATALGGAVAALPLSAKSYNNIIGSNERMNIAVVGINSRGGAHIKAAGNYADDCKVIALCDVDNRTFTKAIKRFDSLNESDITTYGDIRKLLENDDIDVISIATPDFWHAPMAIMAMNAGKNVYLEKPFSFCPEEGEWVMQVQKKTGSVLQIGNQQRSAPTSIEVINAIKQGIIGRAYYAKAWYTNNRKSIGVGKKAAVPDWLDWNLWQGPAPRKEYMDNYVHYNWHWFWHWGTGEISNNGLHELDIARWALGVDIPSKVNSTGGRFHFQDDWEFYDTQLASYEFADGKSINWEGRSCNKYPEFQGKGRGTAIYGTEGTVILDRNGYKVLDNDNNVIKEGTEKQKSATTDTQGIGGLDGYHYKNFIDGIKYGADLNSPATEAHKSTLMCHLGNMAQKFGGSLDIDEVTGRPYSKDAMSMWGREYEPGWVPHV
ncbi:MAG: putative dehydrogenase [Saprospiraceae bacterium]|jgi:predicted dehydrogenase